VSALSGVGIAIRGRWLEYDPLIEALGGPHVFSRTPPPEYAFPDTVRYKYITIGDKTEADGMQVMDDVESLSLTLQTHAWTRGFYDDDTVEEIVEHMQEALKTAPLVIDGYGTVRLRRELVVVMGDPNGVDIRHAPVRYRISTIG
jgi:hypothetical protein